VGDVGIATTVGAIALEPGASIDDLRAQLDSLPNGDVFGLEPAEWVPADVRVAVSAQGQGLAVVAAIVAAAGIAVVGQLVSRQGRVTPGQRSAMRAIGLTRAQVVAVSSCSIVVPVGVGAILAAGAAVLASSRFPVGLARRVEPDPGVLFDPAVHIGAAVVFAGAVSAWVLVSMLPGDRQHSPRGHRGLAEIAVSRMRPGPAATGLRYALIRHPRDPGSVRAPAVALILVQTVLVGAVTFGASVDRLIDDPARHGSNFDFATGAGEDQVPPEIQALLEQDPDVADVTLYGTSFASVGATSLDVTGMERLRGSLEPDVLAGRLPANAREMVLGRTSARELGVDVDDDVVVVGARGPQAFRVTGFAVLPSVEGGDGIGEGGLVTLDGLRRLEPDARLGVAAVRLQRGGTGAADAVERIGAAIGSAVGLPDPPPAIRNLERVRSTPYIVAWSLGALAVLSMSHQLITSARRRRRDLGIVRALGADRRWVSRVLHWQVTVLAVAVTAVSLPLGVAAGRLVSHAYIDRIGGRTDLSVPYTSLLVVATGLLVLGNVAAAVSARAARRDQPGRTESGG
jgi:putative ABC transport system permease protein